jgi:GH35 family endo-1,4-beta-xylanase
MKKTLLFLLALLSTMGVQAQLNQNPDKFLGNITTSYQIDYGNEKFYQLWDQITPENESKWDQIEGMSRGTFTWGNVDRINNYAKLHKFPFKFHTLVWGSQYPNWMNNLSKEEQFKAVEEWMDAIKKRYPNLEMIDVVNEAVDGHAPAPYKEALGGNGVTGIDWIIKAFEMAYERWPNAILIYNDYNTFQWNTDQFISLVTKLRDAGAPVDAYGCQSHDLNGCSVTTLKNSMSKIQNALKMPMYITEYDIGSDDDNYQLNCYKNQFPVLWEASYCAGVTLWGYIYGKTWVENGNSGLIRDGVDRPAMTWLRDYMKTEKALQAKSPFPGRVKEASVYIRPEALRLPVDKPASIEIRTRMRTKTIQKIDFYVNNILYQTLTEAPYVVEYTPKSINKYNLKAVVTTTDNVKYERYSSFTAYGEQKYTDLAQLKNGQAFAIVDEAEGKAFYGSDNQNLKFDTYDLAFRNNVSGYYFKLESLANNSDTSIRKYYLLRLLQVDGSEYNIWGNPGYLNTQPANQTCSFILGLNNQNGQDIKNGAVWDVQYVEGMGFSLKNIGTGLYLHDAGPAKYEQPAYFTFCTTGIVAGVDTPVIANAEKTSTKVYNLQGIAVGTQAQWNNLPKGLYIVGGKKVMKR